ncbi:MAG: ABC transporter ATP-binding protein [Methanosarcinaceae archaeon]|jgi:branched-chain amino acid transport system ATP-binding protein|nr:ABC transporter ATP-binding protein [Methanosarcinaceae archaeon]
MEDTAIVEGRSISKHFGSLRAVDNIDLKICKGTIHSIIGPNGAGKTTIFNLLTGFTPLTSGEIFFKGENISNLAPYIISKKGLARSYQITSIFPDLSVHENVRIAAQSRAKESSSFLKHFNRLKRASEKADEVLESLGLIEKRDLGSKNLPYGEKRILDIGIALATNPEIILLDEPMAGLQAADVQMMTRLVEDISKSLTVILIDHNIDLVISISHTITVLNQGYIIAEGTPNEIQNNAKVQEAYLGGY